MPRRVGTPLALGFQVCPEVTRGYGMTKRVAALASSGSASSGTRRASSMRRWPMNGVSPISRSAAPACSACQRATAERAQRPTASRITPWVTPSFSG